MKYEINYDRPTNLKEAWQGQFDVFSHMEVLAGIPSVLFAITTYKENNLPNVCFAGWSSFSGDANQVYAITPGIYKNSHTYKNILRTGEFVINFLESKYYDDCINTITSNEEDMDEFIAAGFAIESPNIVNAPRIKESFLSLECKLESDINLPKESDISLLISKILNISIQEDFAKNPKLKYSENGFMFYANELLNIETGENDKALLGNFKLVKEV